MCSESVLLTAPQEFQWISQKLVSSPIVHLRLSLQFILCVLTGSLSLFSYKYNLEKNSGFVPPYTVIVG